MQPSALDVQDVLTVVASFVPLAEISTFALVSKAFAASIGPTYFETLRGASNIVDTGLEGWSSRDVLNALYSKDQYEARPQPDEEEKYGIVFRVSRQGYTKYENTPEGHTGVRGVGEKKLVYERRVLLPLIEKDGRLQTSSSIDLYREEVAEESRFGDLFGSPTDYEAEFKHAVQHPGYDDYGRVRGRWLEDYCLDIDRVGLVRLRDKKIRMLSFDGWGMGEEDYALEMDMDADFYNRYDEYGTNTTKLMTLSFKADPNFETELKIPRIGGSINGRFARTTFAVFLSLDFVERVCTHDEVDWEETTLRVAKMWLFRLFER